MVGGLVQQQNVGPLEQQLGQCDARLPAAAQRVGTRRELRLAKAQAVQHRGDRGVGAKPVQRLDAVLHLAVARQQFGLCFQAVRFLTQPRLERRQFGLQRGQLRQRRARFREHVPPRHLDPFLGQMTDLQPTATLYLPGVGFQPSGQHAEQRRLAGAVGSHQPDPVALAEVPVQAAKHLLPAERQADVPELQHGIAAP